MVAEWTAAGPNEPLLRPPSRILVAGVSGSGKTTLAGRIAALTGIPHTEIDALHHGPDWVPRGEFVTEVRELVGRERWITEWQYSQVRELLAGRADVLIWLDLPFARVVLPRLVRRTLRRRWHREMLWNGNVEPPLWTVLRDRDHVVRYAVTGRRKYHQKIPALAAARPDLTIVRLRSPAHVERWMSGPLRDALARPPQL